MIYDVAVVGAGPAGSSAAVALERYGYSIIVVDREKFPRNKVCAGVLPPRIFSEIDVPEKVIERPLEGYRLFSPSGETVESTFPKPGVIVRRERFDAFLVDRLKNQPWHVHISDCIPREDCIEIVGNDFTAKARIIIGCDGVNSRIKKTCVGSESVKDKSGDVALGVQCEITLPAKIIDEQFGCWFEVYYTLPSGYFWVAPLKDAVKIGCGGASDEFKKNSKTVLEDFMKSDALRKRLEGGQVKGFESHLIPMIGPHEELASDRVLLAGDAGGFVFPGTGEGVFYAIKSGRMAAEATSKALEEGRFDSDFLGEKYSETLEKNGLLSLRDVDFVQRVLSSAETAEHYVRKLKALRAQ